MTTSGVHPMDDLRQVGLPPSAPERVERAIAAARAWLLARQDPRGFWCGELEGDTTLESYIILLDAFLGRRGGARAAALARTIRECALPDGGWAQFPGGPADLSVSTLSYFALKVAGEPEDAPLMRRARDVILGLGGADRANTYTRYHLALFGQLGWDEVPAIPPEMILLPDNGAFTVYDMSSWSRTIFVPLSILYAEKPVVALPPSCGAKELFSPSAGAAREAAGRSAGWRRFFHGVDRSLKRYERLPGAGALRRRAVVRARAWIIERLEASAGLSAILPAMANSVMALKVLGDDERVAAELAHLDGLLLADEARGTLRVQPCHSPVWDTVLAAHALVESDLPREAAALARAATWLLGKQTSRPGDWSRRNPAPPGGWYFEHENAFYPDVDDTCMALMVLRRVRGAVPEAAQGDALRRGLAWMLGMQNDDGGWASFDRGNDKRWLTEVPFADHNAMIDPSTADITGRVLESLSHFPGYTASHPVVQRALAFLRRAQEPDGSWFGRWGVNHIYGTWQVLRGVRCIGEDLEAPYVRRGARWLAEHQNADGGWGETIASYDDASKRGVGPSTPSQTAWALMGLFAAGEVDGGAARRGVRWLLEAQNADGTWEQEPWTGTGFPKVFYLNYHYYRHTFPLMALGQYRSARASAAG
ncbi:MAG TPA: squalene--hopene cyclase [Polyangia bacterium]|nr:squalene--hopene cyclase [Polyangia bacterium]